VIKALAFASLFLAVVLCADLARAGKPNPYDDTTGRQPTIVIRANFQDDLSQPVSDTAAASVMATVNDYMGANSYGHVSFPATITPWLTMAISKTCSTSPINQYALQAASDAGYSWSRYKRILFVYPGPCGYEQTGQTGIDHVSFEYIPAPTFNPSAVVRALGRSLTLLPASAENCTSGQDSGCTLINGGDTLTPMGIASVPTHFAAFEKERVAWLGYQGTPQIQIINASGTYQLDVYEEQQKNVKALFWRSPVSGRGWWIERREGGIALWTGGNVQMPCDSPEFNSWDVDGCPVVYPGDLVEKDIDGGSGVDYILDTGQTYSAYQGRFSVTSLGGGAVSVIVPS
jgi:hypothetical protein